MNIISHKYKFVNNVFEEGKEDIEKFITTFDETYTKEKGAYVSQADKDGHKIYLKTKSGELISEEKDSEGKVVLTKRYDLNEKITISSGANEALNKFLQTKDGKITKIEDKKDEKIEELTDQVKRQMAEFDNFRKRTEKEKSQMYEIGAKSIIEKVLPVVDNFERGLAAVPEDKQEDPFVDGMNKIYKQIMTMLEEVGVQPIEAVGREFDPNLHNAVMQTESDEYESGVVAQEMQKGYMYRDSVVRHSMVSVVS